MKHRREIVFGALFGLFFLQAFPSPAAEKVRFILNWIPNNNHTGFHVAIENGYYSREGLAVEVISGKGSGNAVKSVDTRAAEIGMADAAAVVSGRARGSKARMVGSFFVHSPMAIIVLKGSGIREPKDLVGRTLAGTTTAAPHNLFPALARAVGINPDSVKWLTISPGAHVPTLMTKKADAIATYLTDLPPYEKVAAETGVGVEAIRYSDYGIDIYGLSVISSDEWIQANPRALRAFLKASYEGIRWAIERPAEGVDLLLKSRPALSREQSLKGWRMTQELIVSPTVKKHGLGYFIPKKVEFTRDIIAEARKMKQPPATKDLYTNEFLPGIFPPK